MYVSAVSGIVRSTVAVVSPVTVTEESATIAFFASQDTLKRLVSTSGAVKFMPLKVAVSWFPFADIPAFGILNEVNFGTPYICNVL